MIEEHAEHDHLVRLRQGRRLQHFQPQRRRGRGGSCLLLGRQIPFGLAKLKPAAVIGRHRQRQIARMQKLGRRRPSPDLGSQAPIGFHHSPSAPRQKLLEELLGFHLHIEHAARRQRRLATGEIRLQRGEASRSPFPTGYERQQMHDPAGKDAVIADEVDHLQPRLPRGRPEAAAELL